MASDGREQMNYCCCEHDHDCECLFEKLKNSIGSEKAHEQFCIQKCKCKQNIKNSYERRTELWEQIKDRLNITHRSDCQEFSKFYNGLTKDVDFIEFLELQVNKPNFLKKTNQSLNAPEHTKFNYWCCCSSHLSHRESDKF